MWKKLRKNKLTMFGLWVLVILALGAIFAPILGIYDPAAIVADEPLPPSFAHFFGTDDLGRDVWARALYGSRISLTVGFVAVGIAVIIGTIFGALAGYYGGWWDNVIMRFADVMLSFPSIFLILAVQSVLNPNIYNVMIVIGLTSWMGVARLVRGEFLSIREREFVEAARAIGASDFSIIFRHILPNAMAPVLVAATLGISGAILTESALSFFGLGVQPPVSSWGSMLMDAQAYMFDAPWMVMIPGLLIIITVLSFYFVGEGLRQALNPKE